MRVGYSKQLAVAFLVLGVLVLGLNLLTVRHGGGLIRVVPGIVCCLVGIGYLTRPYFLIEGGALVVPAVFGPVKKSYPFQPGQLTEKGGALWIGEKKMGVRRWLADKAAWESVARQLSVDKTFS